MRRSIFALLLLSLAATGARAQIASVDPLRDAQVSRLSWHEVESRADARMKAPAAKDLPYGIVGGVVTYVLVRSLACKLSESSECGFMPAAFAIGFPVGFIVGLGIGSSVNEEDGASAEIP